MKEILKKNLTDRFHLGMTFGYFILGTHYNGLLVGLILALSLYASLAVIGTLIDKIIQIKNRWIKKS